MAIFAKNRAISAPVSLLKRGARKITVLQKFITDNYFVCTDEILNGLGQMYVSDERFKKNIDKVGGDGTAEFVKQAISVYCAH